MTEGEKVVSCPSCHAPVPVDPEWRLVQCPKCGSMVTRMGEDSSYD
ncbi:MAG: hypothetical protein L3K15_04625 [Thermoplasmata archaeon]|nr:hypothetical protein [Thermoplasmata archaeon]